MILEIIPKPILRFYGGLINACQTQGISSSTLRPIVVGYKARFHFLTTDYRGVPAGYETNYEKYYGDASYTASNITINNITEYPVILGELSEGNTIASIGPVRDLGKSNKVSDMD